MTPAQLWAQAGDILREQGFDDIEPTPDGHLLGTYRENTARMADHEALAAYYNAARDFLGRHRFTSPLQQRVWALHVEGRSGKAIRRQLRQERGKGAQRYVDETIRKLRAKMLRKRRPGRPRLATGRGDGCPFVSLRFNDHEMEALRCLQAAWGERFKTVSGLIRTLIVQTASALQRSRVTV